MVIIHKLTRSGFKLSPFFLQRPGPNEILVGCGHKYTLPYRLLCFTIGLLIIKSYMIKDKGSSGKNCYCNLAFPTLR